MFASMDGGRAAAQAGRGRQAAGPRGKLRDTSSSSGWQAELDGLKLSDVIQNEAAPKLDDLADLALPALLPSTPEPSYFQEQQAAAETIKSGFYDHERYPCPCQYEMFQVHNYTKRPRVLHLRCRKRDCRGKCREWLDNREMVNAMLRFNNAMKAGQRLYRFELESAERWPTIHKSIRREHGEYLAVRHNSESVDDSRAAWTIFTTADLAHSTPVSSAADALTDLKRLIDQYAGLRRPVRTSRNWCLPQEHGDGMHSNMGEIPRGHHADLFAEAAATIDAETTLKVPKGGPDATSVTRMVYFDRAAGWHEEGLVEHLYSCLAYEVMPWGDDALPREVFERGRSTPHGPRSGTTSNSANHLTMRSLSAHAPWGGGVCAKNERFWP